MDQAFLAFMERKKLILPFFKALFTKPSVILKALYHGMVPYDRKEYVVKKYGLNKGLKEVDLLDLFPGFNETVEPFSHLYGTSLPIDLAILKQFAKRYSDCAYMEIGSWRGESLANLAPVCKRCVSISLSDDEMRGIGLSEDVIKMQRFYSKKFSNVEHFTGDSTKFDFSKIGTFDVIFVDGDHRYEAVKSDSENAFRLLKNEQSIIIWHDYTEQYEHINWEVFAGILDGSPKDKHGRIYHISNSLCAVYLPFDIASKQQTYPAYPDKTFSISIKGTRI